ncbi:MAG: diphosphomevalonate decarboxylase [Saprospiraceae bacterium]|jgi:diphosphomevalonate decarboxylase|nr:diphosphomevalonate decarboxylase [Saprospiraceae bacterium]
MQNYRNSNLIIESNKVTPDKITWKCPSNIALIKYWGKYGLQLPRNPSLSFTLTHANTETSITYAPKSEYGISFDFYFHGNKRDDFKPKIQNLLEKTIEIFPFLKQLHLTIESTNSFPHSAGIASSASSMAAMALCLCSIEEKLFKPIGSQEEFYKKASYVSRIGSGSACRSIFPIASIWGEFAEIKAASNEFGIPAENLINPVFQTFHDDILIVSKEEKTVSSTAGHGLMEGNIYAENRYQQAKTRMHFLLMAMKSGDLETFGQIVEDEALTLHALMMTSNPSFLLMRPGTLSIIERLRTFRRETKIPAYFTLDAGPNVHLLYPEQFSDVMDEFIRDELSKYCDNYVIKDMVGKGPELI